MINVSAGARRVAALGLIALGAFVSRSPANAAQVDDPLVLGDQATALASAGRYDSALEKYRAALAIFERKADHLGAADTCLRIARVLQAAGRLREAVAYVDRSIRGAGSIPEHGERLS